jgi:hypothetical protein
MAFARLIESKTHLIPGKAFKSDDILQTKDLSRGRSQLKAVAGEYSCSLWTLNSIDRFPGSFSMITQQATRIQVLIKL